MDNLAIITTSDGSHSLLNKSLNETYHSHHGAIQESEHVFISSGLNFWLNRNNPQSIRILEIGFGTGLNALLTWAYMKDRPCQVDYVSLEANPLGREIWSNLNYADKLNMCDEFKSLHEAAWDHYFHAQTNVKILKQHTTLQQVTLEPLRYDLIYYDAFAPNKQPEMWELVMLEKTVRAMSVGGAFVTYCAKGQVKRDLLKLGLTVETLAGPPGKKEMIRALKIR